MIRRYTVAGISRIGSRTYKNSEPHDEHRYQQRKTGRSMSAINSAEGASRRMLNRENKVAPEGKPYSKPTCVFLGFVEWDRDGRLPHEAQDRAMDSASIIGFGENARAATFEEYENSQIQNLPPANDSGLWLHFTGQTGWGLDNGKGYQWKKCIWRRRSLNGTFTEDSCSASICSAIAVQPL